MKSSAQAWIVREYLAGAMQRDLADMLGVTNSVISIVVRRFCDDWSGADVAKQLVYGEDRKVVALNALRQYFLRTDGKIEPPYMDDPVWARLSGRRQFQFHEDYRKARNEHVWLLRAEGLTLAKIGERIGVTKTRVGQIVLQFGHRMQRAMRKTSFSYTN